MDFLKSAVASAISKGPAFPYSFGERVDIDQSIWTLHNGTKRVTATRPTPLDALVSDSITGRRLSMQHIFLRRDRKQVSPSARKERPTQVPYSSTPGCNKGLGYC